MALEAALVRCLILDSGATLAFFMGPSCVVLEASGVAYTLVRPPRLPGDAPNVEAHATSFAPVKQRPLVLKALRFRNRVAADPYFPSWTEDISQDGSKSSSEEQLRPRLDVAHWPSVDDLSRVPPDLARRTSDGGVEVRSLEGQAAVKLCPLGRRLSLTFYVAAQPKEGQESRRSSQSYAAVSSPSHKPDTKSLQITQIYSIKMVPPYLEVPARLVLQVWSKGTTQGSHATRDERECQALAYVATRLPSPPVPLPSPEWHTIDIGHVGNSSRSCISRVVNDEDHVNRPEPHQRHLPSLSADEIFTLAEHAERQWMRLQAKAQIMNGVLGISNAGSANYEEEEEEVALYPSTQGTNMEWTPGATYVALPDTLKSGSEAYSGTGLTDGLEERTANKWVVEVTVHSDKSLLLLDGNYVTRTSLRKRPSETSYGTKLDAQGDESPATTATLSSVNSNEIHTSSPFDSARALEERLLHLNVAPYIHIDCEDDAVPDSPQSTCNRREYCLGPLVSRAVQFRSQLRSPPDQRKTVDSRQSSNLHWYQQPLGEANSEAQTPARPRSGLSAAFADSAALAYLPGNSHGDTCSHSGRTQYTKKCALVRTEVVAAGRLSLYADGTVRGAFTDRTLAVLTPRPHPRCPGATHHCRLVLPDGAEALLPVNPIGIHRNRNTSQPGCSSSAHGGSNSSSSHAVSFVRSPPPPPRFETFAPMITFLQRWGRVAGQGPEAQAADAQQRARAQAAIAKELRRTAVFVRREALIQTPGKVHYENSAPGSSNSPAPGTEKENCTAVRSESTLFDGATTETRFGFGATTGRNMSLRVWGELGSSGARSALAARAMPTGRSE